MSITTTRPTLPSEHEGYPLENGAEPLAFVHTRNGEAVVLAKFGEDFVVWRCWLETFEVEAYGGVGRGTHWVCEGGFYTRDIRKAVRDLCVRGGIEFDPIGG